MNRDILLRCLKIHYPTAQVGLWSDPETNEVSAMAWTHPDGLAQPANEELETLCAAQELVFAQEDAKAAVDAEAERRRGQMLTPGSGQAMIYSVKEAQATAYLAATSPVLDDYPLIAAEVGITGETPEAVAQVIAARAVAWRQFGATVERVRLGAKRDIVAADTPEAVAAILAGLAWPAAS